MAELNFRNPDANTPEWWLLKLSQEIIDRNKRIEVYDNYYSGIQKLDFATPKFREAFGYTFMDFSDNFMKIICDAVNERMNVTGFRYNDTKGDSKAWDIWQQNNLDAMSNMGQLEALVKEESYLMVWPDDSGQPVITVEDPTECIVEFAAGSRTQRAAALKQFINDDGYISATLYLSDGLYKFVSRRKVDAIASGGGKIEWAQREVDGEMWPLPKGKLGTEIPVVPMMNDPRLLMGGTSEIADAIPIQDAINKTVMDMLITSEFTAAPQRWATGFTPPKDENGRPLVDVDHLISRFWASSDSSTQFGQFSQASMAPYVQAVEMLVTHLATRTRTPPHYFYLNGQFPSGQAIVSAETGLVAKSRRKMRIFGEGYEEAQRLAFMVKGDKGRSQYRSMETIWADPESRTESEHIDAVVKRRALGVPLQQLWEDAGYSPQQIERFKEQIAEEQALGLNPDPVAIEQTGRAVIDTATIQAQIEGAAGIGKRAPTTQVPTGGNPASEPPASPPAKK